MAGLNKNTTIKARSLIGRIAALHAAEMGSNPIESIKILSNNFLLCVIFVSRSLIG